MITDSMPIQLAAMSCLRTPVGSRSSAPTMNMNKHQPELRQSVERPEAARIEDVRMQFGAKAPNTIGPSTSPAAISPITGGWPK